MKTIISIIFLTGFGCYHMQAQTATSSGKKAQSQLVTEPAKTETSDKSSATLVSGQKEVTIKETPVDTRETTGNTTPATDVATPLSKKPD